MYDSLPLVEQMRANSKQLTDEGMMEYLQGLQKLVQNEYGWPWNHTANGKKRRCPSVERPHVFICDQM